MKKQILTGVLLSVLAVSSAYAHKDKKESSAYAHKDKKESSAYAHKDKKDAKKPKNSVV